MKFDLGEGRTVNVGFTEDVLIFPVMGGVVNERVRQMLRLANQEKIPVVSSFNGIGIVANPGDEEKEILAAWERVNERGTTEYPYLI